MSRVRPMAERFWAKVDRRGPDDCWLWTANQSRGGYGQFHPAAGDCRVAHRVAYELLVGPVPEGMQLDHLCRVRLCVNPRHLEPVSGRENKLRGETVNAANAAKTQCAAGHVYDEANTRTNARGERQCRLCGRQYSARYRERLRNLTDEGRAAVPK